MVYIPQRKAQFYLFDMYSWLSYLVLTYLTCTFYFIMKRRTLVFNQDNTYGSNIQKTGDKGTTKIDGKEWEGGEREWMWQDKKLLILAKQRTSNCAWFIHSSMEGLKTRNKPWSQDK